ncbi:hypothetical protein A1O1_09145 [Capronia coronata CBS 617.96]|uniref:Palmitoyltransferase n=1 Tax=Capronia coronata CBS 617.96 TaxID=1182541 RepID=W9XET5_9EURO|nr:uncharacterized protein A1O1_09145 [Capronia coronata CBS 617.96]EXJ78743.1 hypothetical protein A1O1_09145 [Capronia coronata CBS 617.96]
MPSYSTPSSSPPPTPSNRRLRSCARKCERGCCAVATYFPLAFVYSLSTWAVWVVASIGFGKSRSRHVWWLIEGICALGILLYGLANLSYTVAVFTDPGSPTQPSSSRGAWRKKGGRKGQTLAQGTYSILPTTEPSATDLSDVQPITVSSTGAPRYCKKCHTPKPDRTHHCSTCGRCVLKMDHHCPWLSTCVGLHNYKAFVLFLIYISLFSWACFASSAWWMWKELFEESGYLDDLAPVNIILLAVIAGIMGLVLTGFTGWHIYLCVKGQTTIEKLEKTRYLSGVRKRVERNRQEQRLNSHRGSAEGVAERLQRAGEQILEFHANAVPGASRFEEGEEHTSPVPSAYNTIRHPQQHSDAYIDDHHYNSGGGEQRNHETPALQALRRTYSNMEAERERTRYAEYLDDRDSETLPNAFDLGWRRNLTHLFGPQPYLWWLPVCNTTGDGWRWEVSEKWMIAQEEASKRKEERLAAVADPNNGNGHGLTGIRGGGGYSDSAPRHYYSQYETDREREYDYPRDHDTLEQDGYFYGDENDNTPRNYSGIGGVYSQNAMSLQHLPNQKNHTRNPPVERGRGRGRGRRRQRRNPSEVTRSGGTNHARAVHRNGSGSSSSSSDDSDDDGDDSGSGSGSNDLR